MPEPHTGIFLTIKELFAIASGAVVAAIAGWRLFIVTKLKQLEGIDIRVKELEKDHISRRYLNRKADEVMMKIDESKKEYNERMNKMEARIYEIVAKK
jgi:hypothetical protein